MFGPKSLVVLACVVNFGAGLFLGVGVDRHFVARSTFFRPHGGPPAEITPERVGFMVEQVRSELGLDDDQTVKVRAILTRRVPQANALLTEFRPKLLALKGEILDELATVLTPAQMENVRSLEKR